MSYSETKSLDELDVTIEKLSEEIDVYRNALTNYLESRSLHDFLTITT